MPDKDKKVQGDLKWLEDHGEAVLDREKIIRKMIENYLQREKEYRIWSSHMRNKKKPKTKIKL